MLVSIFGRLWLIFVREKDGGMYFVISAMCCYSKLIVVVEKKAED